MSLIGHGTPPAQWLSDDPTSAEIQAILDFLTDQGTFKFPTFSTGLFCAAAADNQEFQLTGYQSVWVRDNIHIAHALWVVGEKQLAVDAVSSLMKFYETQRQRILDVLTGKADPADMMQRPHIRFDGETLTNLEEKWAHAQNDALGYLIWLTSKLLCSGDLPVSPQTMDVLSLLVQYLHKIEYWQDEDAGHWEEARKIEASSIGCVVAGLKELKTYLSDHPEVSPQGFENLDQSLEKGQSALEQILPFECIQDDPTINRKHDAALLFLAYPLEVIDDKLTLQIAKNVQEHLQGPIGIRRYNGDSYWCANYRDLLSPETRTTDFSEDMSSRDSLLNPGEEAQWCIFDPILSVIFAKRYQQAGNSSDRELQLHHLRRSLAQLTNAESRFPPYRCPESYFLEKDKWIPNDICPLLWTQANLRLALEFAL